MSSATAITNPLPGIGGDGFTLSKAALSIRQIVGYSGKTPIYSPGFTSLGSAEVIDLKLTPTYAIGKKTDTGVSIEAARALSDIAVAGSMTLLQNSPLITAAAILSADFGRTYTQGAVTSTTKTLVGADPFMAYKIGVKNITVTGVTWGVDLSAAPINLVLNTDYFVNPKTGMVALNAKPATWVSGDPVVTYTATAITSAMGYASMGAFTSAGLRGCLNATGVGIQGTQKEWMIWDALIAPNGTKSIHNNSNDMDKTALDFSIFPVQVDPDGNAVSVNDQFLNVTDV